MLTFSHNCPTILEFYTQDFNRILNMTWRSKSRNPVLTLVLDTPRRFLTILINRSVIRSFNSHNPFDVALSHSSSLALVGSLDSLTCVKRSISINILTDQGRDN